MHTSTKKIDQIDLLQKLIRHHPVYGSKGQHACVVTLSESLKTLGWDEVWIDTYASGGLIREEDYVPVAEFGERYANDLRKEKENIIAVINSGYDGPTVILNGHYDVDLVNSPELWNKNKDWYSGAVRGNRIIGRGASDMLGGLTSLIEVGSRFATNKDSWCGKIILCAVTDEEIGGNGTVRSLNVLKEKGYLHNLQDVVCLIAEPSDNIVATQSLGFMHLKLSAYRKSLHMGMATRENSALYDIIDCISHFDGILAIAEKRLGKLSNEVPPFIYNFGMIHAGEDPAIPIGSIAAEATIFYPPGVSRPHLEAAIKYAINQAHRGIVMVEFSAFGFDGHKTPRSVLAKSIVSNQASGSLATGVFKSPCDARIFSSFGLEDVTIFGPGSLKQAHAVNEYIEIDELYNYNTDLYLGIQQTLKR